MMSWAIREGETDTKTAREKISKEKKQGEGILGLSAGRDEHNIGLSLQDSTAQRSTVAVQRHTRTKPEAKTTS